MNRTFALFLSVTILVLASCGTGGEAPKVLGGDIKLSGTDSAAYLDDISSMPTVTEAKAMQGILLVPDKSPRGKETTFAEAVAVLKERKIVDANWDFQAGREITKGKVAYMTYQACGIRGGLTLTLTGPSRRYCLKELQYRGIMSSGVSYNTVTGMEYLAILGRIDEFRQTGRVAGASAREGGQE